MRGYASHIKLLLKRLLLLLAAFELVRILFFIFNFTHFTPVSLSQLAASLFWGSRFDSAVIVYLNLPFIFLHLVPGNFKNKKGYQVFLKILFFLINSIVLLPNFIDCAYYHYLNKRTTADFFKLFEMGNDVATLMPQYLKDFWYVGLLWIGTISGMFFLYPKNKVNKDMEPAPRVKFYFMQAGIAFFILGIFFSVARGFEFKPLRIISAVDYVETRYAPLVLNSSFTILNTYDVSQVQEKNYFPGTEAEKIFSPIKQFTSNEKFRDCNVVVIILESFSKEYTGAFNNGKGYTPFFDSLMQQGLNCTHAFANGKRSIEAVPSIVSGLPSLMNEAYISSNYSANKINSLATLLKPMGYYSAFFHGGSNGTMGFDKFSKAAGFNAYFGRNEYDNEKDFDGHWGILDEPFFQYFANSMNTFKQPFFTCIFTLSSHHPYPVPEKYKGKFKKGELEIHEAIQYTDYSLKKFFETASAMPWYHNTLFILTADHTAPVLHDFYKNKVGVFAIPVVFFTPGDTSLKGPCNTFTQQIDIMPTVLDYLHYNKPFLCYGNSLFAKGPNHFVINYLDDWYQMIHNDLVFQFDGEKGIALYNLASDSLLTKNILQEETPRASRMERSLKAIIQSYNHRMINNKLVAE